MPNAETELLSKINGECIVIGRKSTSACKDSDISGKRFGFSWFIPTILKFKRQFISILIAVFVIQILGILTPLMTQVVVDKVLTHRAMNTLYSISIGIFIVYVYELIISLCKSYLFVHTTNRIDVTLSARLFKHLFSLPLKYFENRRAGETVARVRELDQIRSFLTGTALSSMIDLVFIIVYIVVMFFYSLSLTAIVIASMPVFALLSIIITPLFKKSLDKKFETGAAAQSFLVESINGIQTIKAFALEGKFEEKWGDLQADYVKAGYNTSIISQTSSATADFIQHVVDLLILVFGAKAVIDGSLSIGQLVAFRMLSGRVSGPVLRLVQLWQEYQQANLSVQRIGDIFNTPSESKPETAISNLPRLQGNIRFDNVRFRYRIDGSDVLHGISFEMKENKIYGLVGRSGSGKSTISKLVQRLYIPHISDTVSLIRYIMENDWNTAWDKNLWEDIESYGYVRDIADWFKSGEFRYKLGTIYALVNSLYRVNKTMYARLLLEILGFYDFDKKKMLYISAEIVKKYCKQFTDSEYDYSLKQDNWFEGLYEQLISGKACCHLEDDDIWNWVREYYINKFKGEIKK